MNEKDKKGKATNNLMAVSSRMTVNAGGKEYPCYFTMGAAIAFRALTGRDTTEMENGLSDFAIYLYACCESACRREKLDFPYNNMMEFADEIDANELARLSEAMLDTGGEKKT